ncbi:hypothetical protein BX600DRAFT_469109 [Xylariales sp. PMI_506]|nr:hypothetical protein BX600DRAFT_469109 [Xylariales sp. PMI_506]
MAGLVHGVPKDLSRTLQVIGAGYSRTGTSSFTLALEILLNGQVLHSGSACIAREEPFIKSWIKILNASGSQDPVVQKDIRVTLRSLCAGFVGITDAPGVLFTGELVEEFPDAIVICTQRDPAKWWKSFHAVAGQVYMLKALNLLFLPLPALRYFGQWIDGMTARHRVLYAEGKPHKTGPDQLESHEAYVRRVTPPERLFFFNVKDGWEPLCKILDVPVPDVPFPHANDADAVKEYMESFIKKALRRWFFIFTTIGVAVGSIWWMLK